MRHVDADELLRSLPGSAERVLFARREPARPASAAVPRRTSAARQELLREAGIESLWSHQAAALDALDDGSNVIVATGTASGKSLIYQLAVAESIARRPSATALMIFPTKALTQDQFGRLRGLGIDDLEAGVYDGDASPELRTWIRQRANVVLTNPDMLHAGILAGHQRWGGFLRNLELIVVDEAHVYRGIFGAQVSLVLRRVRRIAALRGASPRVVLSTATIGNPAEHAENLIGEPCVAITDDGAPSGNRTIIGWEPPEDEDLRSRRSVIGETSSLLATLVDAGATTLAFTRSRRGAEVVASVAAQRSRTDSRFAAYRAGYLPEERRDLETKLLSGELQGVAATTALELGIDVGGLDAVILAGFPGTRAAFRQQIGRAGRSSTDALGIFVVDDDPLDRYLAEHPDELLDPPFEPCSVDPSNPAVLVEHLLCAAHELPLRREDERWFGSSFVEASRAAVLEGKLVPSDGVLRWAGRGTPHRLHGLRSAGERIQVVDRETGGLLGEAGVGQAMRGLHQGAIYVHQGETFEVTELDLEERVAQVQRADVPWYTLARTIGDVDVVSVQDSRPMAGSTLHLGPVVVTEQVVSYARRRVGSGELLDEHALDLPVETLRTVGCWWTFDDAWLGRSGVGPPDLPGALHAAEHAMIAMLPLVVACDKDDVGGISTVLHRTTGLATIVIYDGMEGGAGFSAGGYRAAEKLVTATLEMLQSCSCSHGCPSCVQSARCGNGNEPLHKSGAAKVLTTLLG